VWFFIVPIMKAIVIENRDVDFGIEILCDMLIFLGIMSVLYLIL